MIRFPSCFNRRHLIEAAVAIPCLAFAIWCYHAGKLTLARIGAGIVLLGRVLTIYALAADRARELANAAAPFVGSSK